MLYRNPGWQIAGRGPPFWLVQLPSYGGDSGDNGGVGSVSVNGLGLSMSLKDTLRPGPVVGCGWPGLFGVCDCVCDCTFSKSFSFETVGNSDCNFL